MGEKYPYRTLLGIDWAYENYAIIDLKKELMRFEADGMKVTQPLDPYRVPLFMDRVQGNMEEDTLDHLYTLTTGKHTYYINPTTDGAVSWHNIQFSGEDSELEFDNWK
jgi:hypothetical protein